MSLRNRYGDVEITQPQAMRALAHPVRLAILSHLQRHGPATASQLAPHVGATPSVTSWHLRHLAGFGLVQDHDGGTDRRQRWWQATARGFRFNPAGDAASEVAGRELARQMYRQAGEQLADWVERVEPRLDPAWRALGGLANTRVELTLDELRAVEDTIEKLLAPYVRRKRVPAAARGVRFQRYTLPETEDDA
jgi:DNA-binding transcriptional ArsR family regulator